MVSVEPLEQYAVKEEKEREKESAIEQEVSIDSLARLRVITLQRRPIIVTNNFRERKLDHTYVSRATQSR